MPPVAVPRRVAPKVTVTAELKSVAQSNSRVATSIAPVTVCISPPKPSEVSLPDRCPVPVEKKRTSPKPSKVLPVRCPVPVEKKRDVAAKVPARKPQIVCGAATASPKSMKKPVDDAVPVRPCVKRPGEECSCGDTGCDGPPVFVPSPESASVCSSYDVFLRESSCVEKLCCGSSESCSAELFCC